MMLYVVLCVRLTCMVSALCVCFFFKQKTAYEMRISDWSSDVCSSDLRQRRRADVAWSRVDCRAMGVRAPRPRPDRSDPCPRRGTKGGEIGRASCRERVCQYV